MPSSFPLNISELSRLYRQGELDPVAVLRNVVENVSADKNPGVWIYRCTQDQIDAQLARTMERKHRGIAQPLLGIPFAGKDNIDIAAIPTTVACPAFSYVPSKSAAVVQRLCDAGAIVVGTTNLDQFAAGLVGTRSPYGICRNPFNPQYISGGSSSGSAVAVATGMVSFSLGTDTAGSGRVPAAFNNIVGLKPTRGLISCTGVVPACQSLDCVSLFTLTCEDALTLLNIAEGFDPSDPYSRNRADLPHVPPNPSPLRFGVPQKEQLRFYDDAEAESLYCRSIESLEKHGAVAVEIDYAPFAEAAALLYSGPWLAERFMVVKELLERDPDALLPVTRSILEQGRAISASDTFGAMHRLEVLRQSARRETAKVEMLLLPTTGTIFTINQVQADPIQLNTKLGYYTNFVNLLDLCGVAVPCGFRKAGGVPLGVSLIGPAGTESLMLKVGDALHRAAGCGTGLRRMEIPSSKGSLQ